MSKVFISHSAEDRELASEITKALVDHDIQVFSPEASINAGQDWSRSIRDAIRSADVVIVIITPRSINSKWLQFEVGAAWGMGKTVVPVLSHVDLADMPPVISGFQAFRLERPDDVGRLVHNISRLTKR